MEQHAPQLPTDVIDLIVRQLDEQVVMNLATSSMSLSSSINKIRKDWSYWRDKLEKLMERDLHDYNNKDVSFWKNSYIAYTNSPSLSVFLRNGNVEEIKLYLWLEDVQLMNKHDHIFATLDNAMMRYIIAGNILALRAITGFPEVYYLIEYSEYVMYSGCLNAIVRNNWLDIVQLILLSTLTYNDEVEETDTAVLIMESCMKLNNLDMAQYLIETYASKIEMYDVNGDVMYSNFLYNALEGPPEILRLLVKYPNLEWQCMVGTAVEWKLYGSLDILLREEYISEAGEYVDESLIDECSREVFRKHYIFI
jgi:hypothetical protein